MERVKLFIVFMTVMLLVVLIVITSYTVLNRNNGSTDNGFYVGVTYCGNSFQEAKELIDRVKNFTNIFIVPYQPYRDIVHIEEIGAYAIASNLKFAFSSSDAGVVYSEVFSKVKEKFGEDFVGLYYQDELGGKMLDMYVSLDDLYVQDEGGASHLLVIKATGGAIMTHVNGTVFTTYQPDGEITVSNGSSIVTYYSNGTVTLFEIEHNYLYTMENGTDYLSQIPSYELVLKQNPIQNYDDAAKAFVNKNKVLLERIDKTRFNQEGVLLFTADYGLYWWDYQSGYDLVLAELGWNNTVAQEIGLVRGAATLQGKSWGTIITWKYTHPPFLADGVEMFEQMKTSYEAGADYVIVFNYSEDMANPNTLQEEHFQALERFWNDVVQNPKIKSGSIKAEAVLVLPRNYGWGMRHPDDYIWGIWQQDDTSQQIWEQLQNKLDKHGLKLDIVFEDPNYSVTGKYPNIYYWNQK